MNDDGTIPTNPDPNWLTFNNFRSGDMTAALPGADYADLIGQIDEICNLFCDDDELTVTVRVANQGFAAVADPVEVVLYGITSDGEVELGRTDIQGGIASGIMGSTVMFELSGVDVTTLTNMRVEVDGGDSATDGGAHMECNEENNSATWDQLICP